MHRSWFFYIKKHNVDQRVIQNTFDEAENFFDAPIKEKMEVNIENSETLRGYTALLAAEHEGSGKNFTKALTQH